MSKICTATLLVALILTGCSPWETTKKIYQNRSLPAHIDLQEGTGLNEQERKLSKTLTEADRRIEQLRLAMERQARVPALEWMREQMRAMSWINGLFVLDSSGSPLEQFPESQVKKLDLQAIHRLMQNETSPTMRLIPQQTDFGPEVCLVKPFFDRGTYLGCLLVHFDLRSLLAGLEAARDIMIFVPDKLLWQGETKQLATAVIERNWPELLERDYQGEITVKGHNIYWLVRFIGADPLIYAVEMR